MKWPDNEGLKMFSMIAGDDKNILIDWPGRRLTSGVKIGLTNFPVNQSFIIP